MTALVDRLDENELFATLVGPALAQDLISLKGVRINYDDQRIGVFLDCSQFGMLGTPILNIDLINRRYTNLYNYKRGVPNQLKEIDRMLRDYCIDPDGKVTSN